MISGNEFPRILQCSHGSHPTEYPLTWIKSRFPWSKKSSPEPKTPAGFSSNITIPVFKWVFFPPFNPNNLIFLKTRNSQDLSQCTKSFHISFSSQTKEWKQQLHVAQTLLFLRKGPGSLFSSASSKPFLSNFPVKTWEKNLTGVMKAPFNFWEHQNRASLVGEEKKKLS